MIVIAWALSMHLRTKYGLSLNPWGSSWKPKCSWQELKEKLRDHLLEQDDLSHDKVTCEMLDTPSQEKNEREKIEWSKGEQSDNPREGKGEHELQNDIGLSQGEKEKSEEKNEESEMERR